MYRPTYYRRDAATRRPRTFLRPPHSASSVSSATPSSLLRLVERGLSHSPGQAAIRIAIRRRRLVGARPPDVRRPSSLRICSVGAARRLEQNGYGENRVRLSDYYSRISKIWPAIGIRYLQVARVCGRQLCYIIAIGLGWEKAARDERRREINFPFLHSRR